jgi:hypothetical protein
MQQGHHITPTGAETTVADVWRWGQELERLHARIARRFVRPEPRRRAMAFLKGIVSSTRHKNGWQLAEHAGEARPDGMQRLLNSAVCYPESVVLSQVSHWETISLNVLTNMRITLSVN